jgi:hypothetical protein
MIFSENIFSRHARRNRPRLVSKAQNSTLRSFQNRQAMPCNSSQQDNLEDKKKDVQERHYPILFWSGLDLIPSDNAERFLSALKTLPACGRSSSH